MRFSGEIIGDDLIEKEMDEVIQRAERLPQALDAGAKKIVNRAQQIARLKGLHKTGAGDEGIIFEKENDDRLIGWAPRPNLHLYFHEIGTFKDYPKPHLRPAADQTENEVIEDIRRTVVGD